MTESTLSERDRKWTTFRSCVHRNVQINGQQESAQVVDLHGKVLCPLNENLSVILYVTMSKLRRGTLWRTVAMATSSWAANACRAWSRKVRSPGNTYWFAYSHTSADFTKSCIDTATDRRFNHMRPSIAPRMRPQSA